MRSIGGLPEARCRSEAFCSNIRLKKASILAIELHARSQCVRATMNSVREIIQEQITRQGVVSFETFMELALYCPNLGYYEHPTALIGRAGDFLTSVSVGSVFGELLAFQFADWLEAICGPVQLVEAGAHDGRLARAVLTYPRRVRPELYARLDLWLLEPSAVRQKVQAATLAEHREKARWFAGWNEIAPRR